MNTATTSYSSIESYLTAPGIWEDGILTYLIANPSPAMQANSHYFGHPLWAKEYLEFCHQDETFRSLWGAAMGSWDGVTPELYYDTLEPRGFEVNLYPHNNNVGAAALQGNYGRAKFRWRLLQRLSGLNPDSP